MTEQQPYAVVRATPAYELRRYLQHVVAETLITDTSFEVLVDVPEDEL